MSAGRASAVTFYPLDHPALNLTVKSRLMELLSNARVDLGSGLAQDWADYRYRCGLIAGLQAGIDFCDQMIEEMDR